MTHQINEDNIRVAAYYIWEQAGRPEGKEKECWIKACEQLFAANDKKSASSKSAPKKAAKKPTKKARSAAVKSTAKADPKPVIVPDRTPKAKKVSAK